MLLRNEDTKSNLFKSVEKNLIESMIQREGRIRKAAKVLGVSQTTLIRKNNVSSKGESLIFSRV
ncbi:helix-turn-helix domain-containing protein [Peribacillus sp. NPDC076916]|uniref:helix-turn-helix domain-containing protein n=1 Tax=Peribacillus sp. NPDC076916 TaxID=3390608 RepID=UPI003CFC8180